MKTNVFSVKTFVMSAPVANALNVKRVTIFLQINVKPVHNALANKTVIKNANVQEKGFVKMVNVVA